MKRRMKTWDELLNSLEIWYTFMVVLLFIFSIVYTLYDFIAGTP